MINAFVILMVHLTTSISNDPAHFSPLPREKALALVLNARKAKIGAEIGVQRGLFSQRLLTLWNANTYVLVDPWSYQSNYFDAANVNNEQQNVIMKEALQRTAPFNIKLCRNTSVVCATQITKSVDFLYIDARHDYMGVTEDIESWYHTLSPNAIVAGHDYLTAEDQTQYNPLDRFEINGDGSLDITYRATLGAVDDFWGLKGHPLRVVDSNILWKTWWVDTAISTPPAEIPKTIHFIWISTDWGKDQAALPKQVRQNIAAWKQTNPLWFVVVWTNAMVRKHFPRLLNDVLSKVPLAAFASDILRYAVLAKFGGLYLDTDIVPIKPLTPMFTHKAISVCQDPINALPCKTVCNAVISAPKNAFWIHRLFRSVYRNVRRFFRTREKINWYATTGPDVLTTAVLHNKNVTILKSPVFYPCFWHDTSRCVANNFKNNETVIAMHTWAKSWV